MYYNRLEVFLRLRGIMKANKQRLDSEMVARGLADSRQKAQALIMERSVTVNGVYVTKAGETVREEDTIEIVGEVCPFVSRGGYKLEKACHSFGLDLTDRVCADIGASTGGFTDCMLQHGAKKVYAVEVGYGQLDYRMRIDERVISMERTNARFLDENSFPEKIEFAASDVSFISLKLILPALKKVGIPEVVTLIKPQFEAGREKVGKNGVVREEKTHIEVVRDITSFAAEIGYMPVMLDYSPIKGPKGNIEFICRYVLNPEAEPVSAEYIEEIVKKAHTEL